MTTAEVWRGIAGHEGCYSVSSFGRVRSEARFVERCDGKRQFVRERIMRMARKASGHLSLVLYPDRAHRHHIHRLVAFAFLGPPPSPLHEVAHNDGDPGNNHVSNLRWATRSENHADKVAHGTHNRGERHPLSKLSAAQVRDIRTSRLTLKQLASKHSICFQHAWAIKTGKSRSFE